MVDPRVLLPGPLVMLTSFFSFLLVEPSRQEDSAGKQVPFKLFVKLALFSPFITPFPSDASDLVFSAGSSLPALPLVFPRGLQS